MVITRGEITSVAHTEGKAAAGSGFGFFVFSQVWWVFFYFFSGQQVLISGPLWVKFFF